MGDQLIALGELHWFQTYYPHIPVREFTHDTLLHDRGCRLLLSCIRKQDLLFLHGGGNINDLYVNCERIRRRVLQKCPENRIVLFQQSIHFRDTPEAQQYKAETIRKAFKEEIPGTTKLIIAQRISSIQDSNIIIVMENGQVACVGDHETLMKNSDFYRGIYESQQKGSED